MDTDEQSGDLNTDFHRALAVSLGLNDTWSQYSIDDLWARYILAKVSADSNISPGAPAGRSPPKRGGQHIKHNYPPEWARNKDNANKFPAITLGGDLNLFRPSSLLWETLGDLDEMVSASTRIEQVAFSNGGLAAIQVDSQNDSLTSFSLTTPYDLSTATITGTPRVIVGGVVPRGCEMSEDGDYYLVHRTFGDLAEMYATQTDYVVAASDSLTSSMAKSETGADDTLDGPISMVPDGSALYWIIEMQTNILSMARVPLGTPFDLDAPGTPAQFSIESAHTSVSLPTATLQVFPGEQYMILSSSQGSMLGTMSTPGDVTTLTWSDTTNLITSISGTASSHWMSEEWDTIIVANNNIGLHHVKIWTADGPVIPTGQTSNPYQMTKQKTWDDGGANDLNPLVTGEATSRLGWMDFAKDGERLITVDQSNDKIRIWTLSTPYDFSTAVAQSISFTFAATTPTNVRMDTIGLNYWYYRDNNDTMRCDKMHATLEWNIQSTAGSLLADAIDTEWGHATANTGPCCMSYDGMAAYFLIEDVGGRTRLARRAITPGKISFDLDEMETVESIDVQDDIGSTDHLTTCFQIIGAETNILILQNEILYHGTFGTAGDVTSLVIDTTNTLDVSGDGEMTGFATNEDGTKIWFVSNTSGTPVITEYA